MKAAVMSGKAASIGTHSPKGRPSQSSAKATASMSMVAGRGGTFRPCRSGSRRRRRASHTSRATRKTRPAEEPYISATTMLPPNPEATKPISSNTMSAFSPPQKATTTGAENKRSISAPLLGSARLAPVP
jgi:hypothetical protein